MSQWRWRAVWLGLTALLLAACGSANGGNSAGGSDGTPQSGGSLTLTQLVEPRTLDPATLVNNAGATALVGNSLYGYLLADTGSGQYDYGLAKDLSTSDGGKTWMLQLRDGLTFSDGTPFDAAAVQFNWQRMQAPETLANNRSAASQVASMSASGQVLTFTLNTPISSYPNSIVNTAMNWIAKPGALQLGPAQFDSAPIGAGPFTLKGWQRAGQMTLVRNDRFWDKPRPYLDELVLNSNGDDNQRLNSLATGSADGIISASPALNKQAVDQGFKATTEQFSGGNGLFLNTRVAPFDDIRAREAVMRGIDRNFVQASAFDGQGTVPDTLFVKDSPFYSDAPVAPSYDQQRAQQLFDELAAEGKPVSFAITTFQTTQSMRASQAMQTQLSRFSNVNVQVKVFDTPTAAAAVSRFDFQAVNRGTTFTDPDPVLYDALHTGSPSNINGISDPDIDKALDTGRAAPSTEQREQAYAIVAQRFAALYPTLYYLRLEYSVVYGDHLHGATLYGTGSLRVDGLWATK